MNSPPEDSETRIASFIEATSASRENAHQYLEMAEWDVGVAIELWLDGDGAEGASSAADEEEPAAERAPPSNPAPGPATGRAIHTLNDLNASATHDGHDDDDDSDQDYFAGGEKSGLAVQGNPQSERVNDLLQGLFERARRNAPRPGGDDEPAAQSHFSGRGFTLGGDDAPSRVIEPPQSNIRRPPPRVQRTLYLWQEGFSVDDGPLYLSSDPANERTLAMINSGSAPIHILNVEPNQEVDLTLQNRKDEKYVKPKPKYKPFGGQGHRLGSPGASVVQTAPAQVAPTTPASAGPATPEVALDASQPVVSILFRLGDGTRLPARFNPTHTVADLYGFVDQARAAERAYVLMTTFPSMELADRSLALADVPELSKGGAVVQKWT